MFDNDAKTAYNEARAHRLNIEYLTHKEKALFYFLCSIAASLLALTKIMLEKETNKNDNH